MNHNGLWVPLVAAVYILSGICQPLLMAACKNAGLADSTAQLYMFFYYAGPSFLLFAILPYPCCHNSSRDELRPSKTAIGKAVLVAAFDIIAQTFNYTGASYAGASIFAVIYASVTIWTAVFSRLILGRSISCVQCGAIGIVFGGLCLAGLESIALGSDVLFGTLLIVVGSCMHGATYVLSEAIMTTSTNVVLATSTVDGALHKQQNYRDLLTVLENSAIQGIVACIGLLVWQLIYTLPRWDDLIRQPAVLAGTTKGQAAVLFLSFSISNLLHSLSFYYTVAFYPGGSTSAGVMKGLQAVLVFVAAHILFCGSDDPNNNMCFSIIKFASLVTVVGGVYLFRADTLRAKSATMKGYTYLGSASESERGKLLDL